MNVPETNYTKTADGVHIAYQVFGEGPIDILFVLGWVTHIERMWDEPNFRRFFTRLASFSRVMVFDKRGVGLSDRVPEERLPSLEVRAGVHTGEVESIDGKVGGIAVNVGARIASRAGPSEVLVSHTVQGLVSGSGIRFEDAGEHQLKGVPDHWRLYRVVG